MLDYSSADSIEVAINLNEYYTPLVAKMKESFNKDRAWELNAFFNQMHDWENE